MKVVLSADAINDLSSIRRYVGQENPRAADRLGRRLLAACDSLSVFPERGRLGPRAGTRENVVVWPYVITYQVSGEQVDVLRIWHGAQDRTGE